MELPANKLFTSEIKLSAFVGIEKLFFCCRTLELLAEYKITVKNEA